MIKMFLTSNRGFQLKYVPEVTVKTMDLFLKTHSFSLHKTSQDINWWSEVKWITCGSCLDSDSDGTHSLQRIHWWATDEMLNVSKSVPINKQKHLHLGCPEGELFLCESVIATIFSENFRNSSKIFKSTVHFSVFMFLETGWDMMSSKYYMLQKSTV